MAQKYQYEDFSQKPTWLICRIGIFTQPTPIDAYILVNLPSGFLLSYAVVETELTQQETRAFLIEHKFDEGSMPGCILLAEHDPIEPQVRLLTKPLSVIVEAVPAYLLEDLIKPIEDAFGEFMGCDTSDSNESIEEYLPDSYSLCSCGSGSKFKFCCKPIFRETTLAMSAAEEGKHTEALYWMKKARAIVGETSEILCRESIVYSFVDTQKSSQLLKRCLALNPKHPRAHYILAINLKSEGKIAEAIREYELAISYYPPTDHYHLSEVHNNLGCLYFNSGDLSKARKEWELALQLLPTDPVSRRNLEEFIYTKEETWQA